jgi:hypothetical protein
MDLIQWRDKMQRLPVIMRNVIITDAVAWLESEERGKCKPEHVSFLVDFENQLQQQLNQRPVDGWYIQMGQTYGSFPFFDRYIRKVLKGQ